MPTQRLEFPGSRGQTLSGRLDLPADGKAVACALLAHCFTCSKNSRGVAAISRALAQERVAVFRFDFTGLGESEGELADSTFSRDVDDVVAAAEFMRAQGSPPLLLLGHSLGGAAVVRAAERIPSAVGVVTLGAPFQPEHVTHLFDADRERIAHEGEATVNIGGRPFRVTAALLEDLASVRLEESLADLRRALLVMHSPTDTVVGIGHAARIYTAARHPKSFVSLDSADHLLTDERDAEYAARVIAAWASRYLPGPVRPEAGEAEREGVTTQTPGDVFRTEILAEGHALVGDEPVRVGGTDAGPTPYDLLLAALGACTGMTLGMYARRKGWPLENVAVHLAHERLHAADEKEVCEDREARMDRLHRTVEMQGALTDEQRERLLEIADRCPVHRTLAAGVFIETEEA